MPAVVAIAGHSQSGKTTLLERLIPDLKGRGYRVAAIKHTHKDIQIDQDGKDSWRFAAAGSDAVVISGARQLALVRPLTAEPSLEELIHLLGEEYDIVLVEGFHQAAVPKVEVHRAGVAPDLRCAPDDLLALVTDEPLPVPCPQFSPKDIRPLADLLVAKLLGEHEEEATLSVNGAPIPLGPFSQRIISNTLEGLISTFKGVGRIRSLRVSARPASRRHDV